MSDSESIDDAKNVESPAKSSRDEKPDSFQYIFVDVMSKLNWKVAVILFLVFVILSSELMMEKVYHSIPGAVKNGALTNTGVLVQGVMLVLFYMVVDGLVTAGVI
jgi:hypothetical protein